MGKQRNKVWRFFLVVVSIGIFFAQPSFAQLYISDSYGTAHVDVVSLSGGSVSAYSTGPFSIPEGLAFNASGVLFVANYGGNTISEVTTGGVASTFLSGNGLSNPLGLAFDTSGNLYVANSAGGQIFKVTPGGSVSTFASGLSVPYNLVFDTSGNLYVANLTSNTVSKITPGGSVSTFASGLNNPSSLVFDSNGNLYVAEESGNKIEKFSSSGVDQGSFASISTPLSMTIDTSGNLYVGDVAGNVVKITPGGSESTFVTGLVESFGLLAVSTSNPAVWNGGGVDSNWGTSANWVGGTPSNGYDLQFAGSTNTTANNNNLSTVNSITFNSGSAAFTITGNAFTLTAGLTNNSTSLQTINLGANTITLGGSQSWNAASGPLAVSSPVNTAVYALTVNGSYNTTLSGAVSGGGQLLKTGNGTLALTGTNTYSGGTLIMGGTVSAGSNGLGTGNVSMLSGMLQPASASAQTTTIGGNYAQLGGTLAMRLGGTSSGQYDQLAITGTTTLGGILSMSSLNGFAPQVGQSFQIITSNGESGTFASIVSTIGAPKLVYSSTGVILEYPSYSTISGVNLTPNQQAIGSGINQFSTTATGSSFNLVNALNNLPSNQVPGALSQLAIRNAGMLGNIAIQQGSFLAQQLNDHTDALRIGESGSDIDTAFLANPGFQEAMGVSSGHYLAFNSGGSSSVSDAGGDWNSIPNHPWSFFVRGTLNYANQAQQTNISPSNFDTGGLTAGVDYRLGNQWVVGMLVGYAHTDAYLDNQGSQTHENSYTPGVYASYLNGPFFLDFLGSYGVNTYDTTRIVTFTGYSAAASSSPLGDQYEADLLGGYDFPMKGWMIGPRFALQSLSLDVNGYTETGGGGANLTVNRQFQGSLRSQLGFRVLLNQTNIGALNFSPHLDVRWQHEYMGAQAIGGLFAQPASGSFILQTSIPEANSAVIDAGISANVSRFWSLFMDYAIQAGQASFYDQEFRGGFRANW